MNPRSIKFFRIQEKSISMSENYQLQVFQIEQ